MTQPIEKKAHAGTIADYLHQCEGYFWTRDQTQHVLEHVRQVEKSWMELIGKLNEAMR